MEEIHTSIGIEAPASSVWKLLTDFAGYPKWNPFITRMAGELRLGGRLDADIRFADRTVTINPTIVDLESERKLSWRGRIGRGLFTSEHLLEIRPVTHNRVVLVQAERFTGPVVSIVAKKLDATLRRGFEEMNAAVKRIAEGSFREDTAQAVSE
jgi:hypothetical protein